MFVSEQTEISVDMKMAASSKWKPCDVNGAATEASAMDNEMPASAVRRAPQSLHPSPTMATCRLRENDVSYENCCLHTVCSLIQNVELPQSLEDFNQPLLVFGRHPGKDLGSRDDFLQQRKIVDS